MKSESRLRDKWMWDRGVLRFWILVPAAISIILVLVFYSTQGTSSLFFLLFSLIGILMGAIYGVIGKKVRALKASFSSRRGEVVECLIVSGRVQSPGVAVLGETELFLAPIVGSPRPVKREDIHSVRCVRFFNGKTMLGKRWLVLSTSPRLGLAVPHPVARRWARLLAN